MLKRAIATRYANALFETAKGKGLLDEIERSFPSFVALIESDEDFSRFLTHPAISGAEKKTIVETAFKGGVTPLLFDMICLVIDKQREEYIPLIWEDYKNLLMEHRGQVKAMVHTPFALSPALKTCISASVAKLTGKAVIVEEVVDRSLLGGIKVQIGDRVYDGSIQNKLKSVRELLITAKV